MDQENSSTFKHQISARIRLVTDPNNDIPHLHKLITQMANYHNLTEYLTVTETSLSNTLFKSPPFHSFTALILEVSPNPFPITPHKDLSFNPIIKNNFNLKAPVLDPQSNTFRSENDVYVAGHVLVFPSYNGFFEKPGLNMDQIFVRKCYRGLGFGKMLFSAVASVAASMGMGMVDWLVADWNEESIKFYEKMGAHCVSDYRLYKLYGEKLQQCANISG
ncbi:GCN5-related N-acetyltransferase 8-like [Lycium ferocissimum]|uniref:GCN5-related N-acetyltransferase 8-like n=1 Tax=Lycium ferocissimum TaxID=112874 RepID=UPI00281525B9|nr:GCN5-related N-acetyltransferase 8-like [Lycium ferocissimum]